MKLFESDTDKEGFRTAVELYTGHMNFHNSVGTLNEKGVHSVLKFFYEPDNTYHEINYMGYVADIMRDGSITEIQTSTLNGMKEKLGCFLKSNRVRIVFPVITEKHIAWIDRRDGSVESTGRKVSFENKYSLLSQLLYIEDFFGDPNLTVTAVEISSVDYRMYYIDRNNNITKNRAVKYDSIPDDIFSECDYIFPSDLKEFIPDDLGELFTREDFSKKTRLKGRKLWSAMKVLENSGLISLYEKKNRQNIYRQSV